MDFLTSVDYHYSTHKFVRTHILLWFFLINNSVLRITNSNKLSYVFFDYIIKVTNTKQALITLCLVVSKILLMSPNKLHFKLCMFFLQIL